MEPTERVLELQIANIRPNPYQPRRAFDEESLRELASSIQHHGILQPLTVRPAGDGRWELVAGERRLRAAKLAGLTHVPCLETAADDQRSALLALVENLQRQDLHYFEEAAAIAAYLRQTGATQESAAQALGRSPSAVANKLRLLKLPPDVLEALRENGLTERHGRALLRLQRPEAQREALAYIIDNGLTVAATDAYVDALLSRPEPEPPAEAEKPEHKRTFVLKDVRVFLNTLSRSIDLMKQGGIDAGVQRQETEDSLILTISIPKTKT